MFTQSARKFLALTFAGLCLAFAGASQARADHNDHRDRDAHRRQTVQRRDVSPRQRDRDVRSYRTYDSRWNQTYDSRWNQNRWDSRVVRRGCDSDNWFWSQQNCNPRNCR
jgi:hypothetical protein